MKDFAGGKLDDTTNKVVGSEANNAIDMERFLAEIQERGLYFTSTNSLLIPPERISVAFEESSDVSYPTGIPLGTSWTISLANVGGDLGGRLAMPYFPANKTVNVFVIANIRITYSGTAYPASSPTTATISITPGGCFSTGGAPAQTFSGYTGQKWGDSVNAQATPHGYFCLTHAFFYNPTPTGACYGGTGSLAVNFNYSPTIYDSAKYKWWAKLQFLLTTGENP